MCSWLIRGWRLSLTQHHFEMKTITKPVYYCDFCKKKGLSRFHMEKHEKHCTGNPDRECGICGCRDIKPIIEKYKDRFELKAESIHEIGKPEFVKWRGEPVTHGMILDDVGTCPACALAVVRQSGLWEADQYGAFHFDYHEAHKSWWNEVNKEFRELVGY